MGFKIVSVDQQAKGGFDNNRILENKPIGFMQDGGRQKAFSNLFYWAHAWSVEGGLIGEHPHRGFEIMSYVLEGAIEHYDSKLRGWKRLEKGDLQIIRSGSGISHAEKILPGGEIFQIWFDPGLENALSVPASYNDYKSEVFPVKEENNITIKTIKGEGSPFKMTSEGIEITEIHFNEDSFSLEAPAHEVISGVVVEGELEVNGKSLMKGDFFILSDEKVELIPFFAGRVFLITSPLKPTYNLYIDMVKGYSEQ